MVSCEKHDYGSMKESCCPICLSEQTNLATNAIISAGKSSSPVEPEVSDDFLRELIVSEFDYFLPDQKKYHHIKTLIEAEDFTKFQWVDSGFNEIMTTKRFNEKYTIQKELAKNSR